MAHNAEDEMARGRLSCGGVSIVGGDEAVPNSTGADVMVEQGRTVAGRDRVDVVHSEGERADVWAPLEEGERAQERKRLTGRAKRSAREGSMARRERMGRGGPRAEGEARARVREEKHGPESAQSRGGGVFLFSFLLLLFLNPFSPLYKYSFIFPRCQNEMPCVKCY
jgi:hypothetical protein